MTSFPKHFYDPLRRKIAAEIVQKELLKLLPSVSKEEWQGIYKDIENWFDGERSELASVMDFWDGFEGVTQGFKLKNLIQYLTAENMAWKEENLNVDNLILTANLPIYSQLLKLPFKSEELVCLLNDPKNGDLIEKFKDDSDKHAASSLPRDSYPIITIETEQGYKILDGHRRTIRAILHDKREIKAYVGRFQDESNQPKNFWLSISFLRNLVRIANLNSDNQDIFDSVVLLLGRLLKEHQNILPVFEQRILNSDNFKDEVKSKLREKLGEKF